MQRGKLLPLLRKLRLQIAAAVKRADAPHEGVEACALLRQQSLHPRQLVRRLLAGEGGLRHVRRGGCGQLLFGELAAQRVPIQRGLPRLTAGIRQLRPAAAQGGKGCLRAVEVGDLGGVYAHLRQQLAQTAAAGLLRVVGKGLGAASFLVGGLRLPKQGEVCLDLRGQRGALLFGVALPLRDGLTAQLHGKNGQTRAQYGHAEEYPERKRTLAAQKKRQRGTQRNEKTGENRHEKGGEFFRHDGGGLLAQLCLPRRVERVLLLPLL